MFAQGISREHHVDAARDLRDLVDLETQRRVRRRIVGWTVTGVFAVGVAVAVYAMWPAPPTPEELFRIHDAREATVVQRVSATGHLEARSSVDVGARISGTIAEVLVDEGEAVRKGQILARFEDEKLDAQSDQARASVKAARASLAQAKVDRKQAARELARIQTLASKGVESTANVEKAQAAVDELDETIATLSAQVSLQRSSRALADMTLRDAAIVSPIDGVILTRGVDPGQTVAATFQTPVLFTVAEDLARLRVVADVDEADVTKVGVGQRATFTVDALPRHDFGATVVQVRNAARIVSGVVTYEVLLDAENVGGQLRPGMTTTVKITTAEAKDVVCVPNGALRFTPPPSSLDEETRAEGDGARRARLDDPLVRTIVETPTIWVLRDGKPAPIAVTTGISDGRCTEVAGEGLMKGIPVIVDLTARGREVFSP